MSAHAVRCGAVRRGAERPNNLEGYSDAPRREDVRRGAERPNNLEGYSDAPRREDVGAS